MFETDHRQDDDVSYLTFVLAEQLCAVPVLCVRDVLAPQVVTRIPLAPPEIAGSLNLRGRIVTAIDLRKRLGFPSTTDARMSIVTQLGGDLYALLVDSVQDVVSLSTSQIERNPPTLGVQWATYSNGVCRRPDALLVLFDATRLLRFEEMAA